MKYFTPELVQQLNSSDGDTVDEAMERWEKAILAYKKHLQKLQGEMPVQLQAVTKLSLHDWKLAGIWHDSRRGGTVLLVLQHDADFVLLKYVLSKKPRRADAPRGWSATDRVDWLYDEVDFDGENQKSYVHRMLFSDGTTLVLPFSGCSVLSVQSGRTVSHSDLLQIA